MITRVFYLFIILNLMSCTNSSKKDIWGKKVTNKLENLIGKKVSILKDMPIINVKNQINSNDKEYTLIVAVDLDCSVCIQDLSYWKYFRQKTLSYNFNCEYIYYVHSKEMEDAERILKYVGFDYPCYLDKDNIFSKTYEIKDKRFKTLLLRDNTVILMGNPVLNKKLENLYFKVLNGEYKN